MNELRKRLAADMKVAMKAGDRPRLDTIRLMLAALQDAALQQAGDEMTLDREQAVLRKMIKSARDAIDQASAVGREDIVAHESAQLELIGSYLPEQLSGAALQAKVRELADELGYSGPKDIGRFMKEWKARHANLAEGRDVQAALRDLGDAP